MTRMRMGVCSEPGCPELTTSTYCPTCAARRERARGTRQQRGYGRDHERHRAKFKPKVEAGHTRCARCTLPILPGDAWALDHTDDRTGYLGPSHKRCNDAAGGKAAHSA